MIVGTESRLRPGILSQYPTPAADVLSSAFEQGLADNPLSRLIEEFSTNFAYNTSSKLLNPVEAKARMKQAGVNFPVSDFVREDQLDALIERQYQAKVRREAIESYPGGSTFLQLTGGVAASVMDPLNVAASFIPIVGQARYASWLAKAAGPLGRAGVRAGVGAIEGAVGAAALEPINYFLAQELGDDYTTVNSLLNIGFGGILGAGLHAGVGAIHDALSSGIPWTQAKPKGKIAEQLSNSTPEVRLDLARTAAAQAIEDRRINVGPIKHEEAISLRQQMRFIDENIKFLSEQPAPDLKTLHHLEVEKKQLKERMEKTGLLETTAEVSEERLTLRQATEQGLLKETREQEFVIDRDEILRTRLDRTSALKEVEDLLENAFLSDADIFIRRNGNDIPIANLKGNQLLTNEGDVIKLDNLINQKAKDQLVIKPKEPLEYVTPAEPLSLQEEIQSAQTNPDSAFVDQEVLQQQAKEFSEIKRIENPLEEIQKQVNDAVSELESELRSRGLEPEGILKGADEGIQLANDYQKTLMAYANCIVRNSP